jgi:hypothetical protein
MRTVGALALGLGLLGASCSLVTDLGGYAGGGAGDASTPAVTEAGAGPSDAGPKTSNVDAGSYCKNNPGHVLCADFDDGTTGPFDGKSVGDGTIDLSGGSLRVSQKAGAAVETTIGHAFQLGNVSKIVCEFDVQRVTEVPVDGDRQVIFAGSIGAAPIGMTLWEVKEEQTAGRQYVETRWNADGGVDSVFPSFDRLTKPGGWVRLRAELSFADQRVSLARDGVSIDVRSAPTVPPSAVKMVALKFGIQPIVTPTKAAWAMAFDNIVCDL